MLITFSSHKECQSWCDQKWWRQRWRCKLWILIVAIGLLSPSVHAKTDRYCFDDWACVEKTEINKNVTYWLVNQKPFVITTTLEVKSSNLSKADSNQTQFTIHQVLEGFERRQVLHLQPIQAKKGIWYDESFYWAPGNMQAKHDVNSVYHYPYSPDQYFRVVQGFGGWYSHRGASRFAVDFAMPVGTPIYAARAGTVIDLQQKNSRGGPSRKYAEYANYIIILHEDGTTGEYFHLKQNGVTVSLGEKVKAGQKIGYSGNTGFSSLPHLHFAVYRAKPFGKFESLPFEFMAR